MSSSRREVLLRGAMIGAGVIASNLRGIDALAQAQPPERRSLQGLDWNDPIVASYRDAVGIMKQKPDNDRFSWVNLCNLHGTDPDNYRYCPHGNWYFLPWHRAYVLTYERIIRKLVSNNSFAMPFWDWTANPTMPAVFLSPNTPPPDNKRNWLFVDDQGFGDRWRREWPANRPMPASQVGSSVLRRALEPTDFEQFGTSRPSAQNNLDQSWIIAQNTGNQGVLESSPHNMVHNNIGGWMPTAVSPRDPIFFMHHCNIDRIWAVWNSMGNQNSSDPLWRDMIFRENFYNDDGSFYSPKVTDLFVPEALGYTYGLTTPPQAAAPPAVVALETQLKAVRAAPGVSSPSAKAFSAPAAGTATAAKPLEVSVNVDPALLKGIVQRKKQGSGTEFLGLGASREQRASGPRAYAFIRDVATTDSRYTEYRVFLDRPNLTADVPVTDPSYVGSFGIFAHRAHGAGAHGNPSFAMDLTDAIERVYGGTPPGDTIKLQILPVPSGEDAAKVGTATPSRVEVAIITG